MPTETNLTKLNINRLTKAQYLEADIQGNIQANEIYVLKDAEYSAGATIDDTSISTTTTYSSSKINDLVSTSGTANIKFRIWG